MLTVSFERLPSAGIGNSALSMAKSRRERGLAMLVSLMLAACASAPVVPPEEIVRQRANERWAALVKRDFAKAYTYSTPAYRALVNTDAYRDRFSQGNWSGGEVVKVACPEVAQCISTVRIEMKSLLFRKYGDNISTHYDEIWLLEEGQWWLQQK
jgi:hypothetical protein